MIMKRLRGVFRDVGVHCVNTATVTLVVNAFVGGAALAGFTLLATGVVLIGLAVSGSSDRSDDC